MTLISVIGDRGSGKTTFTTLEGLRDVRSIFCNYHIDSERYNELDLEKMHEIASSIIIGDEWYTEIDARNSSSKGNVYASYILNQSRKDENDFLITAQLFKSVDLRWREQSDYIVHCSREDDNKVDGDFIFQLFKQSDSNPQLVKKKVTFTFMQENVFPFFNTRQKILLPDKLRGMSFNVKEHLLEIEKIVDDMILFDKVQPRSFTMAAAKWYCTNHDELHQGYAEPIYQAMKRRIA